MVPETSELQAFVAVADAGSVTAAATELAVPRATVSRRLARLEEHLGVRLLHRTTRRVELTALGKELHGQARGILKAVDAAARSVQRDDGRPRGLLRISMPPMGGSGAGFINILVDFLEGHPEVQLEVVASTRHEDLIANNIDVALRAGSDIDPDLVARRVHTARAFAVAAPEYLARAGVPTSAKELASHSCLVGFARGERPATHWPLKDGGRVRVNGDVVSNEPRLLRAAALRGRGIALLPEDFTIDELEAGTLVPVLEDEVGTISTVALVYPEKKYLRPAVRAFVDHALRWIKEDWPTRP